MTWIFCLPTARKCSIALLFTVMIAAALLVVPSPSPAQQRGEQVVLLHGLAHSSANMASLARHLEERGFTVFNLDYPSTRQTVETNAALVAADLARQMDPSRPVHFVGFSLGGIVMRAVLNKYRPDNLGRAVQLASPNGGTEVADALQQIWLYEQVFGPAGQELTTTNGAIEALLGPVDYELGILAGNVSVDPVSSAIIPGPDDGKVSVQSTKVAGMRDHLVVQASHPFFTHTPEVQQQTVNFLRFGAFLR